LRWSRDILYTQTLALTSQTNGGRSARIPRSRPKATEFSLVLVQYLNQVRYFVAAAALPLTPGHLLS
jgi:hypothetical protein